jgi:hypothetical protein
MDIKQYLPSAFTALWFLLGLPAITWLALVQYNPTMHWWQVLFTFWLGYAILISYTLIYQLVTRKE